MGIESERLNDKNGSVRYRFRERNGDEGSIRLEQRFVGPTVQSILTHAKSRRESEFTVFHPSIEPEVLETARLVNLMGGNIEIKTGEGQDFMRIRGVGKLGKADFTIMSDPNALVSYAAAALITNGALLIGGVDGSDKLNAFLDLMYRMGASYDYFAQERDLFIHPSLGRLKPVNLTTDFWPAKCHTDWQQILTPLMAVLPGVSYVDENVTEKRFGNIEALSQMGGRFELMHGSDRITNPRFQTDGLDHTLKISGPVRFRGTKVTAPQDVRGATSILVAALAAEGQTEIRGAGQIERGLDDYRGLLTSVGARIDSF
jgi:UDP-N-acetylglucosamine 1-carboxyvinyltransferase